MKYALANMLNGAGIQGLDPDAKAYINAVIAAGATVTSTQRNAINTFLKNGKAGGWWSSIKRIYLPIWGVAAPNAIDMNSRVSGTFVGNVLHTSTGFVETTSPTGYFTPNATPASLGITSGDAMIFSASYQGEQDFMGCAGASNSRLLIGRVSGIRRTFIPSTATGVGTGTDSLGILMGSRTGNVTSLFQRKSSGWITPQTLTNIDAVALPAFTPIFLGNFNTSGTPTTGRTTGAKYITYGYGLSLSATNAENFTLALKNLWETCTGLSMP